jgi:hypothetical protein
VPCNIDDFADAEKAGPPFAFDRLQRQFIGIDTAQRHLSRAVTLSGSRSQQPEPPANLPLFHVTILSTPAMMWQKRMCDQHPPTG